MLSGVLFCFCFQAVTTILSRKLDLGRALDMHTNGARMNELNE